MKKFKKVLLLVITLLSLFFVACKEEPKDENKEYNVYFMLDDSEVNSLVVKDGEKINPYEVEEKDGCIFSGWCIDDECTIKFNFNEGITSDTLIYGKYLTGYYKVSFVTNSEDVIEPVIVKKRDKLETVPVPTKYQYVFEGWFTDKDFNGRFDAVRPITSNMTLYAKWSFDESFYVNVKYDFNGYECWISKDALYKDFYTYFYYFLKNETDCNMDTVSLEEFLIAGKTWELDGKSDMYHFGDKYGKYYVSVKVGGTLEEQSDKCFIGYCYKNGKFIDVIHHLETFFEYWRTDEGYSQGDPLGNDFYAQPWASMVDTAKFFYFTADTLQTKYAWFTSARVKKALDEIPGININPCTPRIFVGEECDILSDLNFVGYNYEGLYLDANYTIPATKIEKGTSEITIYVKITKK